MMKSIGKSVTFLKSKIKLNFSGASHTYFSIKCIIEAVTVLGEMAQKCCFVNLSERHSQKDIFLKRELLSIYNEQLALRNKSQELNMIYNMHCGHLILFTLIRPKNFIICSTEQSLHQLHFLHI